MFIEILFKMLLFKGGVLIYAEHCIYIYIYIYKLILLYLVLFDSHLTHLHSKVYLFLYLVLQQDISI